MVNISFHICRQIITLRRGWVWWGGVSIEKAASAVLDLEGDETEGGKSHREKMKWCVCACMRVCACVCVCVRVRACVCVCV